MPTVAAKGLEAGESAVVARDSCSSVSTRCCGLWRDMSAALRKVTIALSNSSAGGLAASAGSLDLDDESYSAVAAESDCRLQRRRRHE